MLKPAFQKHRILKDCAINLFIYVKPIRKLNQWTINNSVLLKYKITLNRAYC
jgi:hypothetical protein